MNLDELTIGQAKQLAGMFGTNQPEGLSRMLNQKVIIRTYTAGVWFGTITEKSGNEVIVKDARRLWRWQAEKSISLSGVALYGVTHQKSRIAPPVASVWLEAIELIECTPIAIAKIEAAPNAEAE